MAVMAFGAPSLLRKRRYCAPRYVWLSSRVEAPRRSAVAARIHSGDALEFIGEMEEDCSCFISRSFSGAVPPSPAVGPDRQKRAGASVIAGRIR